MFNHEQWADYYLTIGHKDGKAEGLIYGGFWGFAAGFLTYYFFWSRS